MKLDDFLADPTPGTSREAFQNRRFLYLERFVNDGSPSGFTSGPHQVSSEFRPEVDRPSFMVPTLVAPSGPETIEISGGIPGNQIGIVEKMGGAIPIHPDVAQDNFLKAGMTRGLSFRAAPTSSARTSSPWGLLPRPERGRAMLQQAQAMALNRDEIRQDRPELPRRTPASA